MTNLLIAEDDLSIVASYKNFLTEDKNLSIIANVHDGEKALQLYKEKKPDILLLDLGLPKKDGISLINDLSYYGENDNKCNIIVVSGDATLRYNLLNTKKVYKVIPKPFDLEYLLESIRDYEKENSQKDFPIEKLNQILLKLNLRLHSTSCIHLVDVIKYCYFRPYMLNNIKNIYNIISIQYNCSYESIKSSIRSSIRIAKKCSDENLLYSLFYINNRDCNKVLSPRYFIECIVEYLYEFC